MLITAYEYSYLFVLAIYLVAPEKDERLPQEVAAAALEHPEGQVLLELHRALLRIQMPWHTQRLLRAARKIVVMIAARNDFS